MKFTQEQIDKKLKEIQASIPPDLLKFEDKFQYPTVHKVVEAALESDTISEEKKDQLRMLKRLGLFDKTLQVLSEDKQKDINKFLTTKINDAIRDGELPPASQSPFIKSLRKRKWM